MSIVHSSKNKSEQRPLGDLASFVNGCAFKPADWEDSGLPIVRIQNLTGTQDKFNRTTRKVGEKYYIDDGDLLISWSASLGAYIWNGGRAVLNQHIFKAVPHEGVDKEYLYFVVQHVLDILKAKTHGSTMKHVKRGDFEETLVPFPPLTEQRRIVDILKRADGIRRLRKKAQVTSRQLIPALFIDMFGDPASNPKEWDVVTFADVGMLDRGKSKHRPRNDPALFGGPYPFIQTGDVANSGGVIRKFSATYSEVGLQQSRLWPAGTLCITIAANIADTATLGFDACFPDSVVGFIPINMVTTEYVQYWLSFLKPVLESSAPQLAQKNINLKILRSLPIMVPPIEIQNEFVKRLADVQSIQGQQEAAQIGAESSFQALLHRAFSGGA